MEEENRRILEFSKQQQAREEARMAVKKAEEEAKAAVQDQLTKKIMLEQEQADEMERCVCAHACVCMCVRTCVYVCMFVSGSGEGEECLHR